MKQKTWFFPFSFGASKKASHAIRVATSLKGIFHQRKAKYQWLKFCRRRLNLSTWIGFFSSYSPKGGLKRYALKKDRRSGRSKFRLEPFLISTDVLVLVLSYLLKTRENFEDFYKKSFAEHIHAFHPRLTKTCSISLFNWRRNAHSSFFHLQTFGLFQTLFLKAFENRTKNLENRKKERRKPLLKPNLYTHLLLFSGPLMAIYGAYLLKSCLLQPNTKSSEKSSAQK